MSRRRNSWCLTSPRGTLRFKSPGIILCMRPANKRRCYNTTPSHIDCVHAQNDPWTPYHFFTIRRNGANYPAVMRQLLVWNYPRANNSQTKGWGSRQDCFTTSNSEKHDDVIKWKLFSALLAICAGNSPVPGEFPAQKPVTQSFDISFDPRLNKRLRKQSWGWWFEMLSRPLWRHRNVESKDICDIFWSPCCLD